MRIEGEIRRLTAAEERELAMQRPALGDAWKGSEARRVLIECNIPWAAKLAREYGSPRLGEDNLSVALIALCKAVDTFDPDRGRMTTHSNLIIRQGLGRAAITDIGTIRIPVEIAEHIRAADSGRLRPVPARRSWVAALIPAARAAMKEVSLDAVGGDGLFSATITDPQWGVEQTSSREATLAAEAVGMLPPHLAELVRLRHLEAGGMSLDDTARHLGLKNVTAAYLLTVAYRKLRLMLAEPGGKTA